VGLAKLDIGGAGQLVGAKLGGVSFAGGGGIFAGEGQRSGSGGVASLPRRGQMSAVGGNFLGYYLVIILFLSGGMGENLLFGWKGEIYCLCLGYYHVKPCLCCILK
jgi:hypothetical protein